MKKILIIGAGFLQTFVIKKAKEIGYYVLCVDGNPKADGYKYADEYETINITDKEACLLYAQNKQIDGVMTAATDYGVLTASYIAEKLNLHGNSMQSSLLIKNKYQVRKCLFEAKADDTEQAYEISDLAQAEKIKDTIQYPVMVKPCDGSGSRGASKVESASELYEAIQYAINGSLTRKAVIESFIDGNEYGVESLVCNGEIYVMGVMKKKMTNPPYYAELGHQIPSEFSKEFEAKITNSVKKAIQALGVTFGSVNMDLLITADGKIHIVDIGARMGGTLIGSHIIQAGTGVDYLRSLIKATVGDQVDFQVKSNPKAVVTRLLALTPGKICELPNFEEIEKKYSVTILHHLKVGETINEYHTNLDGCGYVIATAEGVAEAVYRAEAALKEIDESIVRG